MALSPINVSDTGAEVREKINAAIAATDTKADAGDAIKANERPGDSTNLFTNVTIGAPSDVAPLPTGNVAAVGGRGNVWRAEGTAVVATRKVARLQEGRKYLIRATFRRAVNGSDPSGDAIVLAIQGLNVNFTSAGAPVALVTTPSLTPDDGPRTVSVVVSTSAGVGVNVVLSAAAYFRVYLHAYGSTCQTDTRSQFGT